MKQERERLPGTMARAVQEAYDKGEEDEALLPRVLVEEDGKPVGRIQDRDPVIFYDIRGEREVELTRAFVEPDFPHFATKGMTARFFTMIEYHSSLPVEVAFPPESELKGTLVEAATAGGFEVVKIAESEKAIHITYFLNGKREEPFPGERRVIVESPKDVANYDQKPEMAAPQVREAAVRELSRPGRSLIIVNFANVDVVSHIENEPAVLRAIRAVDRELGRLLEAAKERGIPALVTADHGTAEKWLYPDGKVDTGHTDSPVPFLLVDETRKRVSLAKEGALSDVAPTALKLLGISPPQEMTGRSLLRDDSLPPPPEKLLLIILDGWGYREEEFGNLILKAETPVMDRLRAEFPFTTLEASGTAVGMPPGKVGNSESGHLHLGAGRLVLSDRVKIDRALEDGSFYRNPAFKKAMKIAAEEGRPLHLLGIVSFYSSHGSLDHLYALLRMAKAEGARKVFVHSLLGRRGERPEAGAAYINDVEKFCRDLGLGQVVTVMGRFWALDRENNWDRVEKAYRALVEGKGVPVPAGAS